MAEYSTGDSVFEKCWICKNDELRIGSILQSNGIKVTPIIDGYKIHIDDEDTDKIIIVNVCYICKRLLKVL